MRRTQDTFQTVKTEGAILPADLLRRIVDGDTDVPGLSAEDYHLAKSERLNEVATRAWNRLQGTWEGFKAAMAKLPESDAGTSLTRERWLLILFQELGYGRLTTRKAYEIDGKSYPVSHEWQNTPIHLVSFRQEIDKRTPGRAGAARVSPHSLVQELLSRSDDHLWGFVSNGLTLRLLRDNVSLTRQAYVEFDLQAMMDSEAYSDFFLLFLLSHQSRVEVPEGKTPESCWLEKWCNTAAQQGVRALDQLRDGVQNAIEALGGGFLAHPANAELREKLRSGRLSTQDYYRQVLRQVYRLLFLFVAEDRDLLFDPRAPTGTHKLYTDHYSTQRLRSLAAKTRGTRHPDLWRVLHLVLTKLYGGCQHLALPALGSFLFAPQSTTDLNDVDIANKDLLKAIRSLAFTVDRNVLRPVSYRHLGPEELGSVYESLLEMHPTVQMDATNPEDRFKLTVATGSERKTTGSYYTPTSLVNCLLDSALDSVLDEACRKDDPEQALLDLTICDPACGSGHFLIAAAHRAAKRLAAIRAGEDEPSPVYYQHALRDIIGHCIYGVDMNPMAVELCKISLWIEALQPGKPLAFLDHHIQCGNSLLGTTPALMKRGIPDEAFEPIEGDDKTLCRELKKENKDERKGQGLLFRDTRPWDRLGNLPSSMITLDEMSDDTVQAIEQKQSRYAEIVNSTPYRFGHLLADTWCAAFVWKKTKEFDYCITERIYREIEKNPHNTAPWMEAEIRRLGEQYHFFHWQLAFPDIFTPKSDEQIADDELTGWSGGFDCVLGNPPWEQVERESEHAKAPAAEDLTPAVQHFVSHAGRYPLTGSGRKNLYALFAETSFVIRKSTGRLGQIYPTGIVQDKPAERLADFLFRSKLVVHIYDFENRTIWFPDVHPQYRFSLICIASDREQCRFLWDIFDLAEIAHSARAYYQTYDEIRAFCISGFKVPMFRQLIDARIATQCHHTGKLIGELSSGKTPQLKSGLIFNFGQKEKAAKLPYLPDGVMQMDYLPVYEGEYIHHFDHRFATYDGTQVIATGIGEHRSPGSVVTATYLPHTFVRDRLCQIAGYEPHWIVVLRRQARATDTYIAIGAIIPPCGVEGSLTAFFPLSSSSREAVGLCCNFNTHAFNYLLSLRQAGPNVNKGVYEQVPLAGQLWTGRPLTWLGEDGLSWLMRRGLEMTCSAWDMQGLSLDCGYDGPPFIWDEKRRFLIHCELDAAFFHLYLGNDQEWTQSGSKELLAYFPTPRDAVEYIMETFPSVKRKDEQAHGCYRTKDTILEIYDEMAEVMRRNAAAQASSGQPTACYRTRLDPPPGPPTDAAGNFIPMSQWNPNNWPGHIHPPRGHQQ
jgi:hypothetical protein